jgi:hypothetical protein
LTAEQFSTDSDLVRTTLARSTEPHWQEFVSHWTSS